MNVWGSQSHNLLWQHIWDIHGQQLPHWLAGILEHTGTVVYKAIPNITKYVDHISSYPKTTIVQHTIVSNFHTIKLLTGTQDVNGHSTMMMIDAFFEVQTYCTNKTNDDFNHSLTSSTKRQVLKINVECSAKFNNIDKYVSEVDTSNNYQVIGLSKTGDGQIQWGLVALLVTGQF